jgi:hypothetical protein
MISDELFHRLVVNHRVVAGRQELHGDSGSQVVSH